MASTTTMVTVCVWWAGVGDGGFQELVALGVERRKWRCVQRR